MDFSSSASTQKSQLQNLQAMDRLYYYRRFAFPYYVLGAALVVSVSVFLFKFYIVRKRTLELQRRGLVSVSIQILVDRSSSVRLAKCSSRQCHPFILSLAIFLFSHVSCPGFPKMLTHTIFPISLDERILKWGLSSILMLGLLSLSPWLLPLLQPCLRLRRSTIFLNFQLYAIFCTL